MPEKIINILKNASIAILEIYNQSDQIVIQNKEDNSPLTLADKASHEIILAGLLEITPTIPVMSEEGNNFQFQKNNIKLYWCIDPLDGTKEFINKNGEFCINIALIKNGNVIESYVSNPVGGDIYWAKKGFGAFKLNKLGVISKLNCNHFNPECNELSIATSRSHLNTETENFLKDYNSPKLIQLGSALKFIKIAEGEIDIYPRLAPTMEWDTAAPQLILEEAGGRVVEYETKENLKYGKNTMINPSFIAYGKGSLK